MAEPKESTYTTTPLYFGCYRESGHFLWLPEMKTTDQRHPWYQERSVVPWGTGLEGVLAPPRARLGDAAIHHKDGWTAIAFWDRSVDPRPGSNSVFLIPEQLEFDEAVKAAREAFPKVWEALTCTVRLSGPRRKVRNDKHPPPKWRIEEAFVAKGPEGRTLTPCATREDATLAAWDAHQQLPLPMDDER